MMSDIKQTWESPTEKSSPFDPPPEVTRDESNCCSISEVVEKTGVTAKQLYYWETTGLLAPQHLRFGQRLFRRYRPTDLETVFEIKAWLGLGYSLEGVRRLKQSNPADQPAGSPT